MTCKKRMKNVSDKAKVTEITCGMSCNLSFWSTQCRWAIEKISSFIQKTFYTCWIYVRHQLLRSYFHLAHSVFSEGDMVKAKTGWRTYRSCKEQCFKILNKRLLYSHSWRTPHKVFAWLISNKSRAHFFLIVSAQRHGVEQVNLSIWKRDEMVEQLSDLTKTEVDPIDLSVSHRLRETNPTHHHRRNCHPVINPPRASSRVGGCGQISLGEHLICSPKWHTDKWSITPTWE